MICNGCEYVHKLRNPLKVTCPASKSEAAAELNYMKRIQKYDLAAIMGVGRYFEGDYSNAFEHWTKVAHLSNVDAHLRLSCLYLYHFGKDVEKDEEKGAAICCSCCV